MNNAILYNKAKSLQRQDAEDVLNAYMHLMQWKKGDTSLDIGCGDGDTTVNLLLKKMPPDCGMLVAVDRSPEMLKYASKRYPHTNVVYQHMDIGSADMEKKHGNVYNHLFSFNCIHWIRDQTCAVKNIYNLLKDDGDFLLTMIARHHIFDSYKVLSQYPRWKEYMSDYQAHISPYNDSPDPVGNFEKLLNCEGFKNIRVDHVNKKHKFKGVESLQNTAAAVNPFLKNIPIELHQQYIDDYTDYVKELGLYKEDDYYGEYTYSVLMAYGHK